MRLWPFPKKSDNEPMDAGFDLPEGVMLAAPDEEPLQPATVPSYAQPESSAPLIDPAAAIQSPEEIALFGPAAHPGIKSDNESTIEAFNMLFTPNAPPITTAAPEALPFALAEEPLPSAVFQPELTGPSPEEKQRESLDQLLAQLEKPTSASSGAFQMEGSLPETSELEPNKQATEKISLGSWDLSPMEAPPLSSDWSLAPLEPEAASTFSLEEFNLGGEIYQPTHAKESIPVPLTNPSPASSLSECLNSALPSGPEPLPLQSGKLPIGNDQTLALASPAKPTTEMRQPSILPRSSMLDSLLPQATSDSSQPTPPVIAQQIGQSSAQAKGATDWDSGLMESTGQTEPAMDDFSLAIPSIDDWGTAATLIELDSEPAMPRPMATEAAQPELTEAEAALMPPKSTPTYQPSSLLSLLQTAAPLEIRESADSWSSAEDLEPEPADLNSSSAAYDMNHYDDPDEPLEAIELDEPLPAHSTGGDLQAMADLLSNVIPYGADETAGSVSFMAQPEETLAEDEAESFAALPEHTKGFLFDTFQEVLPGEQSLTDGIHMAPEDEATFAAQDEPATNATEPIVEFWTEPADWRPSSSEESIEATEEQMLKLNGNRTSSDPSILETLSAKFITKPKPEPASDPIMAEAPRLMQQPVLPEPMPETEDELPIDPAALADQLSASTLKQPSLSQAMSHFEQDMLLKETRFIKQSINNLVDRYFAQQEQDSSF